MTKCWFRFAQIACIVALFSGCASQGWQKFSANSVLQNSPSAEHLPKTLEVFIFADGDQPSSQTVIDI